MSRITLTIDHLALRGLDDAQRRALMAGLRQELERSLGQMARGQHRARAQRIPVLRLPAQGLGSGAPGARFLGTTVAKAIAAKLRP